MKKSVWIIIAAAIVVVALVLMVVFVLNGNDKPMVLVPDLKGNWRSAGNLTDGKGEVAYEAFTFTDDKVTVKYDDHSVASKYAVTDDVITFDDFGKNYHINGSNEDIVRFFTSDNTFICLVRTKLTDEEYAAAEVSAPTGRWKVTYRSFATVVSEEIIVIGNDKIEDFRDGNSVPAFSSGYVWTDSRIVAADISKDMRVNFIDADHITFFETDTANVWLLERVKD